MTVIYFLIAVGILVAGGFLAAFIWSVKSGQYDDDYTPSVRILFENHKSENAEINLSNPESELKKEQSEQSNNNKS
ncbi:MAG: cbb3-type cytochrome oxidase assembly protein CcoS [Bacteroidales bacterium]|nr:cbb3-type cytochrome oxidase assembly protein CcoS [Bacteroidales bacterium]MCF8404546.1 cbb3-type cytochrome oxidase assembly protein CcoS [Bacteroidales bacterium]